MVLRLVAEIPQSISSSTKVIRINLPNQAHKMHLLCWGFYLCSVTTVERKMENCKTCDLQVEALLSDYPIMNQ